MLEAMGSSEPTDLSIYDRLRRSDDEVVSLLVSGAHARELQAYLGEAEYATLAPLAPAGAVDAAAPIVLIIPGIMGTQLGRDNAAPWPANLLWLDPVDIIAGRLAELRLSDAQPLRTLGAISYSYLGLMLRLRVAGLDAYCFEYDWRHSILRAGAALAAHLGALPSRPVLIVAHSMGGLVARAALRDPGCSRRVQRVITLGTPHLGAPAPAQALRGVYPTVRRLAALDLHHSAEQLATEVFGGFPSLYEMLPANLLDWQFWPRHGPTARAGLLQAALTSIDRLAPLDERFVCIAGSGQRTVTGVTSSARELVYQITSHGDGTVPVASAAPEGAAARFSVYEHSVLPRDGAIASALLPLLGVGTAPCALPTQAPAIAADTVLVGDDVLRTTYANKIDWRTLTPDERRRYLNQLNLAPPQYFLRS
jgi:pimeloyl-ACP methyl ester carboxylesterase